MTKESCVCLCYPLTGGSEDRQSAYLKVQQMILEPFIARTDCQADTNVALRAMTQTGILIPPQHPNRLD